MRYGYFRKVAKPYPQGPAFPIDDEWRAKVLARMEEKGIRKGQLAKLIGRDPSSITVLFRPTTVQSRLVPEIHQVLELEPPSMADAGTPQGIPDEVEAEMHQLIGEMSDEDKRHLLYMARRILGRPPQK